MSSVIEQVLSLRKTGGYCIDGTLCVIEVAGAQAAQFLQARLSNDVLALSPGQGQAACFLDRQAKILAALTVHRLEETFWLLVDRSQASEVLKLLDEFRFREQVQFHSLDDSKFFCVHSPKADLLLANCGVKADALSVAEHAIARLNVFDQPTVIIRHSPMGEPGLIFVDAMPCIALSRIEEVAGALHMVPLSEAACLAARIENGYLLKELAGLMMAETGMAATAASYSKGCFPGQEVLARIRTYGAPRQGFIGFLFEPGTASQQAIERNIQAGCTVQLQNKDVGTVIAACYSPTLSRFIAIVMVQREQRVPDQTLSVNIAGAPYSVTTVALPFVSREDRAHRAKALYARALNVFASGSEQEASDMLRQVIELNPTFADAYESLGVILSRLDRLDDAIDMMKQLAILDPQSIMSHANLSVFYMQKGDKAAAEDEKAIAMSIRMSQMARAVADEQAERDKQAANKADAEQRVEMFQQVLQIDPNDFLANAGLGSVYVDLEEYDRAIEPLKKALSTRPNHTVAYVALARAYEQLGRREDAIETYRKGVAIAAQRGDGEPLKKMQLRLDKLTRQASA